MDEIVFPWAPKSYSYPAKKTSNKDTNYNCASWVVGINDRWLWPFNDLNPYWYWPADIKEGDEVESFIDFFSNMGYVICFSEIYEENYDKVVVYGDSEGPTHLAKQLDKKYWSSKIGDMEDVKHELKTFENSRYGNIKLFMKRYNPKFKMLLPKNK